jgi:hypothetical protein
MAAALLSAYSGGLLYEGFISDRYSGILTYPFVDRPSAQRAFDRLAEDAPPSERAQSALRLVQADPGSPNSWNAVAYADWLNHHGLTAAGVTALEHSYTISAFDRTNAVWRVGFALENWAALTPGLRRQVMTEAQLVLHDVDLEPDLLDRLRAVRSAEGQMAATLILAMNASHPRPEASGR